MIYYSLIIIAVFIVGRTIMYLTNPKLGGNISKEYKLELEKSPNYKNGLFQNPVETKMPPPKKETMLEFFKSGINRKPDKTIENIPFDKKQFETATDTAAIAYSWFGHSSILLKVEGQNLLIDPVFGERVSMFNFMGPKNFDYQAKISVEQLPKIDAVLISHDHYDHLDYKTIKELITKVKKFYVPLGVRAHLEKWGVPAENITDLDWWDEVRFDADLTFALTPARHFSGRGITNRYATLWGGWAILGKTKKVYFSGDSGYFPGFKKIGEKYGPFDLAFVECGQYNEDWKVIHMMPEESAVAATDVNAKVVVPIHWGKFKLSLHTWTDPIERFLKASEEKNYKVQTPTPGEVVVGDTPSKGNWWKQ